MTRRRIGDDPTVKEWSTFYISLADGPKRTQRTLEALTDGELRWVLQRSLAEVERRNIAKETIKRLRNTAVETNA